MNFGDAWKSFMGEMDKKTVFEILDFFYDQGMNNPRHGSANG
jgi:hypothetical protein